MKLNTLEEALVEELKDIYDAEHQLVEALPLMAKAAGNAKLKAGFEEHLKQTQGHVTRLEEAFKALGQEPKRHTCQAMKGLVREGSEVIKDEAKKSVHDAFLIAAAQKVEHYEIATYGTLCTWARAIDRKDVHDILHKNHREEVETDEKLPRLAEGTINEKAV
jgi:ferritin-like metal-binding protein YciE